MEECIFCKIAKHEIESAIVFENDQMVVFKDIHPKARVHLLLIPKKHIESVNHLSDEDKNLFSDIIFLAKKMATDHGLDKTGYKLLFNVGRGGGQLVDHLHLHLMGGGVLND